MARHSKRNIKDYVGRLRKRKTPLVLTVNSRAELVVQDTGSYQQILERSGRAGTIAGIREGMKQFDLGDGIALDEAEKRLRKKYGFSR
jgi:hypothetical protein